MSDREKKTVKILIIAESVFLALLTVICRIWLFPYMAQKSLLHVEISTHIFVIGLTATIFSAFAVVFRRKWKSHKIYILIPAVLTVFGYFLTVAANEVIF